MTSETIYLDNNSTTQIHPEVVEAMTECFRQGLANPASQHGPGRQARRVLDDAREQIAEILGTSLQPVRRDHVIVTSGGTESNNLAIRGLVGVPGEVLISAIEHPSALAAAEELAAQGFCIRSMPITVSGHLDVERFISQLSDRTQLVCVMLGNNEIGTLQPIESISRICRDRNIPLHCDAVQAVGKLSVDFGKLGVTSLAFSAHKFHGPRGIGGLLLRHDVALRPLLVGGSQQLGYRPGTESVAAVVGMAKALEIAHRGGGTVAERMRAQRDRLEARLEQAVPCVITGAEPRLPQTTNVAFPGIDRQALVMALDLAGVACSTGSACTSGSSEPSHVLQATGCPQEVVESSIRLSVSALTTDAEVELAADRILAIVNDLRS